MSDQLLTVRDYIQDVRTLIQDRVQPYRYDDRSVLRAFNISLLEGRRLRPDLFLRNGKIHVPNFTSSSGEEVNMEEGFRLAFVYGTAGHVLQRDDEDVQDARANSYMNAFHGVLSGTQPGPIQGGTPGPGSAQK